MEIDGREICETVADGEAVSKEQQTMWIMNWITKGDVMGYARHVREEMAKRSEKTA